MWPSERAGRSSLLSSRSASIWPRSNRLVVTDRWQNYEVATGPDGEALLAPDFKKPLGDTYWLEGKSEASSEE